MGLPPRRTKPRSHAMYVIEQTSSYCPVTVRHTHEKPMKTFLKSALTLSALVAASHAAAQITLYEGEGFRGRAYTSARPVTNMNRSGLDDRTSSVVVEDGRWEVCEHANF